jgi:hypothetical protein
VNTFLRVFRQTLLLEAALAVLFDLITRRSPPIRVSAFRRELARCPEEGRHRLLQEAAAEALTVKRRAIFYAIAVVITSAAAALGHTIQTGMDPRLGSLVLGLATGAGFAVALWIGDRLVRDQYLALIVPQLTTWRVPMVWAASTSGLTAVGSDTEWQGQTVRIA